MSLTDFLVNVLLGLLAFFLTRYIALMVVPEGQDRDKIVTIVAILVGVVVFLADFAARLTI